MKKRNHRFSPVDLFPQVNLENRVVLSASTLSSAVHVAAHSAHRMGTVTGLSISSGTLGQPTTFDVTVRAAASQGSPQGTVNLVDHGKIIQTLTLTPMTSTNAKFAYSSASYTLAPKPGGDAIFFGKYSIQAKYTPSNGSFAKSSVSKSFTVTQPNYTSLANGVKIATIASGTGPAIQAGQTANVLYTGFLSKKGTIFDNSQSHGGIPMSFTVGAGQMIPGFDAGTRGMQAGETRIIEIPPSQGYGSMANGSIPGNSTLIFLVTMTSIS